MIAAITEPARSIEASWRARKVAALEEYANQQEEEELKRAAWREQFKRAAKCGTAAPEKPVSALKEPIARRLITSDATYESLQKLLSENPAGLFVLRDELAGWLAGLERPGREQERAFALECWNGDGGFTVDRIGRGSIHVEHACISLFGGIQPGKLRAYLADALRDGPSNDGLIQRFQLLGWPDEPRNWRYVDRPPDRKAMEIATAVYQAIAGMEAANPIVLRFTPQAQQMFIAWLTELECRIRDGDLSPIMQAHLAKYRSLMPALALLFSLSDGCMDSVSLHHAQLAADWCTYLEAHAVRVYSSQRNPGEGAIALAKRLPQLGKDKEGIFSLRDVYRRHWHGLDTPEQARAALAVLEEHGCVRRLSEDGSGPGRPSEIFVINPLIGGSEC